MGLIARTLNRDGARAAAFAAVVADAEAIRSVYFNTFEYTCAALLARDRATREANKLIRRTEDLILDFDAPDNAVVTAWRAAWGVAQEQDRRLQSAAKQRAEVNRSTLARMLHALPHAERTLLRREFVRVAYPDVGNDPRCAGSALDEAAMLDDRSDEQSVGLEELAIGYWPKYDELTERLVDLLRGRENRRDADDKGREVEEEARFLRDELSARAAIHLWMLLDDPQVRRVPALSQLLGTATK
jgi:hypothetical protein